GESDLVQRDPPPRPDGHRRRPGAGVLHGDPRIPSHQGDAAGGGPRSWRRGARAGAGRGGCRGSVRRAAGGSRPPQLPRRRPGRPRAGRPDLRRPRRAARRDRGHRGAEDPGAGVPGSGQHPARADGALRV
ncbi:MAG: hypothetical protein AVDCRST_MAG59-2292, partial [uncultured Thermomicrobiales bacterium]